MCLCVHVHLCAWICPVSSHQALSPPSGHFHPSVSNLKKSPLATTPLPQISPTLKAQLLFYLLTVL